jgi:hypothetical protein
MNFVFYFGRVHVTPLGVPFSTYFKGIQAVRIDFYFILKVANIRCFILIVVEIFHNIINSLERRKYVAFDFCHVLSSSTNNFAHAQTFSRMSSLSGRMNIARVNIGFFTGFKKIKQRRNKRIAFS